MKERRKIDEISWNDQDAFAQDEWTAKEKEPLGDVEPWILDYEGEYEEPEPEEGPDFAELMAEWERAFAFDFKSFVSKKLDEMGLGLPGGEERPCRHGEGGP